MQKKQRKTPRTWIMYKMGRNFLGDIIWQDTLLVLKFSHRVLCTLCPVAVAILNFRSTKKNPQNFVEVYPLIILTKLQFNWSSGFRGVL
jgi:hypothetical protein